MRPVVIIPARLGSTRLPRKPLADIAGEPMIVHCWRAARDADIGEVLVATDSPEVAEVVAAAGGRAVLTREGHPSGSDRIHEALGIADPDRRYDQVLNLQGDLPAIRAEALRRVLEPLEDAAVDLSTLVAEIHTVHEAVASSVVKMVGTVIAPRRFRALYFSRAQVPAGDGPLYHHIGIYGWRRAALERFVGLPPSALELREKLEQLRAIEAGFRVDAVEVDEAPLGVDTPGDLDLVRAAFAARAAGLEVG